MKCDNPECFAEGKIRWSELWLCPDHYKMLWRGLRDQERQDHEAMDLRHDRMEDAARDTQEETDDEN